MSKPKRFFISAVHADDPDPAAYPVGCDAVEIEFDDDSICALLRYHMAFLALGEGAERLTMRTPPGLKFRWLSGEIKGVEDGSVPDRLESGSRVACGCNSEWATHSRRSFLSADYQADDVLTEITRGFVRWIGAFGAFGDDGCVTQGVAWDELGELASGLYVA